MSWVNQIVQGIMLGGFYGVIACGLSFMFSVMQIINLAHGSLAIVASFALWVLADWLGLSPFTGLAFVLPAMALIGVGLQRAILERSIRGGALVPILATFGLAIVIENCLFEAFGADTRSLAPLIGALSYESWEIASDIYIGKLAALTFVTAIVILGGLQMLLSRTQLGRTIRATAEDSDTAGLVGVNARAANAAAAAIAMTTVGIAGALLGMRATFDAYAGSPQLLFAFEAAVIGGTGSLWGTLIGGIVLGLAQSIGAKFNPQGFLLGGHVVFLLILFTRINLSGASVPKGFGRIMKRSAS
jgi:branched-chain amino acid transport system permease protein